MLWIFSALPSRLFLEIHKVFLRKRRIDRTKNLSQPALASRSLVYTDALFSDCTKKGENAVKLKAQIMDEAALGRALTRISHEIVERSRGVDNVVLVGIRRRGEPIACRIRENIDRIEDKQIPCGSLDIKFYRDDLSKLSEQPETRRASLPFDVSDRDVVLCDDVIYTGRTARAAIEAVFSLGRPRSIQLAVLIDRGHRELPIRPDYVGKNIPTSRSELVEVRLPEFDGETGVFLMDLGE